MFCRSLFVLFLLTIVLSVPLQYTDSDYLPLISSNSSWLYIETPGLHNNKCKKDSFVCCQPIAWLYMFNATFNHISISSVRSALLMEETWENKTHYRRSLTHFINKVYRVHLRMYLHFCTCFRIPLNYLHYTILKVILLYYIYYWIKYV